MKCHVTRRGSASIYHYKFDRYLFVGLRYTRYKNLEIRPSLLTTLIHQATINFYSLVIQLACDNHLGDLLDGLEQMSKKMPQTNANVNPFLASQRDEKFKIHSPKTTASKAAPKKPTLPEQQTMKAPAKNPFSVKHETMPIVTKSDEEKENHTEELNRTFREPDEPIVEQNLEMEFDDIDLDAIDFDDFGQGFTNKEVVKKAESVWLNEEMDQVQLKPIVERCEALPDTGKSGRRIYWLDAYHDKKIQGSAALPTVDY